MTPAAILACYIALSLLDLGWTVFLTALNYSSVSAHGATVPPELSGSVSVEEAGKAAGYSKARMRLGFAMGPAMTAVALAAAASGLFGRLDSLVSGLTASAYWRGVLFLGSVLLARAILASPFSIYSTFSLERRFGFNTTKAGTWAMDALKGALLSALLGLPLLWLLYAFMDGAGRLWWLEAAAIFSALNIGLSIVYPLLIAPLFNKFRPLEEGSLSARIGELARRLDFKVSGILVMDGSKRSKHSNAYFTGLGRTKRIVLFDTLVAQMTEDEILAVLAHEIGHEKRRHVLKMTLASVAFSFLGFWVLDLMMGWKELYAAFGFALASRHALLLALALVSGPATFFLAPAFSAWSRKREYEADAYAAANAGASREEGARALSSALVRLNRENASNLWPHPLYSAWHYSHPTLRERLAAIAAPEGTRRP
jgi:STE24 endopeptidase